MVNLMERGLILLDRLSSHYRRTAVLAVPVTSATTPSAAARQFSRDRRQCRLGGHRRGTDGRFIGPFIRV